MPECLLLAYHENIDRLRAERLLDAAQAAAYPHLGKDGPTRWWNATLRRATRMVHAASVFTFNGVAMSGRQLKRQLADVLGKGFSE